LTSNICSLQINQSSIIHHPHPIKKTAHQPEKLFSSRLISPPEYLFLLFSLETYHININAENGDFQNNEKRITGCKHPSFFAHSFISITTSTRHLPHYLSNYHRFHLYYLR
jgi:hypothetical protein